MKGYFYLLLIFAFTACAKTHDPAKLKKQIVGQWQCYSSSSEGESLLYRDGAPAIIEFNEHSFIPYPGSKKLDWSIDNDGLKMGIDPVYKHLTINSDTMIWQEKSGEGIEMRHEFTRIRRGSAGEIN